MDLKKLQTLLDEALAAETKESLNAFKNNNISDKKFILIYNFYVSSHQLNLF